MSTRCIFVPTTSTRSAAGGQQLLELFGQERQAAREAARGVAEVTYELFRGGRPLPLRPGDASRRASPMLWSTSPPKIGSGRCTSRYGATIASRRGKRAVRTMSLATHAAGYCGPMGASVWSKNSVLVEAG